MDQPKIERMLRLMKMMAGNRNYTIDELAEKLGTVKSKFSAYNFKKIRIPQFSETGFGSFVGLFSCFCVYKQ